MSEEPQGKRWTVKAALDWALTVAGQTGNTALAVALVDAGADVCHGGSEPLFEAAKHGHTDTALWLLDAGADPAPRLRQGFSAAAAAAVENELKTAKAILDWMDLKSRGSDYPGRTIAYPRLNRFPK